MTSCNCNKLLASHIWGDGYESQFCSYTIVPLNIAKFELGDVFVFAFLYSGK